MTDDNGPRVLVGVSGFSYPGWKGTFYPGDLQNDRLLEYYASKLNTVEINSSFYAPPSIATVKSWDVKTPGNFRFSVKAPRQITHILKLEVGSADAALKLDETLFSLGSKRGPILFQLPPYSRQNLKVLESFLENTGPLKEKAFEFRHRSWLDDSTFKLLERYDATFCVAETEDMEPVLKITGKSGYFRLRRDFYDIRMIDDWAKKIRDTIKGTDHAYVYLRHDETGENASLALRLMKQI